MGAPAEYKVRFYENGKDLIIVSRLVGSLQCLAGYYHIKDGHLLGEPSNELFGKTWDFVPTEGGRGG